MRLYSYTNMYLEGIHAGIQTAHVLGELNTKYALRDDLEDEHIKLLDWQKNHKTIFIYNGGYSSSLRLRYAELKVYAKHFKLPFAKFHEGKDALDGALTCVGIIVPENLYDHKNREASPESAEGALYALLHNCKHAR